MDASGTAPAVFVGDVGCVVGAAVAGGAVPVVGVAVVPAGFVVDTIVPPVVVATGAMVVLVDVLLVLVDDEVAVVVSSRAEVAESMRAATTSSDAVLFAAPRSPLAHAAATVTTSAMTRHRSLGNRMETVSARRGPI